VPGSGRNETVLESLILKQANNSRLSDRCSAEDCDVLENGVVVGRMFKVPVPLQDRPGCGRAVIMAKSDERPLYEPTSDAAMAAWAPSRSACVAYCCIAVFMIGILS
jgi:hypothetical protein